MQKNFSERRAYKQVSRYTSKYLNRKNFHKKLFQIIHNMPTDIPRKYDRLNICSPYAL
jgi:hypothetical protein